MDLAQFDTTTLANVGVAIDIMALRTGKPSGVKITVYGSDSERFVEARTARAREVADIMGGNGGSDLTAQQLDMLACKMLAACTKGWEGLTHEGAPLEFSEQKATWLYSRYPAIREQINRAIADRANFLQA